MFLLMLACTGPVGDSKGPLDSATLETGDSARDTSADTGGDTSGDTAVDTEDPQDTGDTAEDTGEPWDTAVPDDAEEHCGTVSSDTTWSGAHVLTCDVEVLGATLTIDAGAQVRFAKGQDLFIGATDTAGALLVQGTDAEPVRFSPQESGDDQHGGSLVVRALGEASVNALQIRNAGRGQDAVVILNGAELHADGLSIEDSAKIGVYTKNGGTFSEGSSGVVISGTEGSAISTVGKLAHRIPEADSSYGGEVLIRGGTIDADVRWGDIGVPYTLDNAVYVGGTESSPAGLTLEAGVEIEAKKGVSLEIAVDNDPAAFAVEGTASKPVVLRSVSGEVGGWQGLVLYPGTTSAAVSELEIQDGGGGSWSASLRVDSVELLAEGLLISNGADAGVYLKRGGAFASGSKDVVLSGNATPVLTTAPGVASLAMSGVDLTGNTEDAIHVDDDGEVSTDSSWVDLGVPIVLDTNLDVEGAHLEIEAGNELRFGLDRGLYVGCEGGTSSLHIAGTASSPVVLTSDGGGAGDWSGLVICDTAIDATTLIEHAEIELGGGEYLSGNVHIVNAEPTLSSCTLRDSAEWGIYVFGEDLTPTLSGLSYSGNASGEITYEW